MPADRSNKRSSFSGRTSPYGEPPREQINPETNEECMQRGKSRSASVSRTEIQKPPRSNPMNPGARGVTTSSARDTKQSNRKVPAGPQHQNTDGQLPNHASFVPAMHLRLDHPTYRTPLPRAPSVAEQRKASMVAGRQSTQNQSLPACQNCPLTPLPSAHVTLTPPPGCPLRASVPIDHARKQTAPQASTSKSVPLDKSLGGNFMGIERPSMSQPNLASRSPHVPPPLGSNFIHVNSHVFGPGQFTNNNIQMSVPSNFNSQWNSSRSASSNGFYNAARQFPDNTQMSETLPSDLSFQLNSGNPLRPQGSASRNDFLNVPAHGGFPFVSTNFQAGSSTGDRLGFGTYVPQPSSSYGHPHFEGSGYQNTIYSPMEGFSAAAPPVPYAPQMIGISPLCYEFSKSLLSTAASRLPTVPPKETKEKKDH